MSVRLHNKNNDDPLDDQVRDALSSDARMLAGEARINDDIAPDAAPNRRLRNWILLANAVAWVAIVMLLRWLFS